MDQQVVEDKSPLYLCIIIISYASLSSSAKQMSSSQFFLEGLRLWYHKVHTNLVTIVLVMSGRILAIAASFCGVVD